MEFKEVMIEHEDSIMILECLKIFIGFDPNVPRHHTVLLEKVFFEKVEEIDAFLEMCSHRLTINVKGEKTLFNMDYVQHKIMAEVQIHPTRGATFIVNRFMFMGE